MMGWESVSEITPESRGDVVQIAHKMWSPSHIWQHDYNPHLNKNQAVEAVTTWVGMDLIKIEMFVPKLQRAVYDNLSYDEDAKLLEDKSHRALPGLTVRHYLAYTADAETMCRALLDTYDQYKRGFF